MDLDDLAHLRAVDRSDMLGHLDAMADQLASAWQAAPGLPLPETHRRPQRIVLCGMGGSAIGGSLTAALLAPRAPIPFEVVRGYSLPANVRGPETLVIASSNSGNTEETLAAADEALERGVRLLAITTGGTLAQHAQQHGYPLWQFHYVSQPRAALGWSFGLLLGLAQRLGLLPDLPAMVEETVALLRARQQNYAASTPVSANPAKRGAGQVMGRLPVFFGGGLFEPVALRWKGQMHENAKAWAEAEPMPEADHNTIAGFGYPADHGLPLTAVFITSGQYDHPRVRLRHELTYQLCLQNGIMADKFIPLGISPLAQMSHAIQYGDYVSYYAAIGYGVDPTEIAPIAELKAMLAEAS